MRKRKAPEGFTYARIGETGNEARGREESEEESEESKEEAGEEQEEQDEDEESEESEAEETEEEKKSNAPAAKRAKAKKAAAQKKKAAAQKRVPAEKKGPAKKAAEEKPKLEPKPKRAAAEARTHCRLHPALIHFYARLTHRFGRSLSVSRSEATINPRRRADRCGSARRPRASPTRASARTARRRVGEAMNGHASNTISCCHRHINVHTPPQHNRTRLT